MNENQEFLLSKKTMQILSEIYKNNNNTYIAKLAKVSDTSYSHAVRVVSKLEKLGIIKTEKVGRKAVVTLTEIGKELAGHIYEVFRISSVL